MTDSKGLYFPPPVERTKAAIAEEIRQGLHLVISSPPYEPHAIVTKVVSNLCMACNLHPRTASSLYCGTCDAGRAKRVNPKRDPIHWYALLAILALGILIAGFTSYCHKPDRPAYARTK